MTGSQWSGGGSGGGGGTPGGSDTQVQYNDSNAFGGDSGLTYNETTDVLSVTGGLTINSGTGASYLNLRNTVWTASTPSMIVYGTIPDAAGTYIGASFSFSVTGTADRTIRGVTIGAGSNGINGNTNVCSLFIDQRSGSNAAVASDGGGQPDGNVGAYSISWETANATDEHVGMWGEAFSNAKAWGVIGLAFGTNAAFTNRVGVTGAAMKSNATGSAMGGYFYLSENTSEAQVGTNAKLSAAYTAALVCNNAAADYDIFLAKHNGTDMLKVDNNGNVTVAQALINTPVTVALSSDDQAVSVTNISTLFLTSDDGTAANRTFTLTGGVAGQRLLIVWNDSSGAAELVDSSTMKLVGGTSWTPDDHVGDNIELICLDGSVWAEISRAAVGA